MIVNLWSVSNLALDGLSLGLAGVTGAGAVRLLLSGSVPRLPLVFWQGIVLLGLRALDWPLFYLGLESFIPEIQGAMCVFGVRNVLPHLTRALELLKPFLALLSLVWLLLFRLEHFFPPLDGKAAAGGGRILPGMLFCCALLAGADSAGSLALWWGMDPGLTVTCCSTVTDIPERFTVWLPESLLGGVWTARLWWLTLGMNGLLLGLLITGRTRMEHSGRHAPLLLAIAAAALVTSGLDWLLLVEEIAPRLMDLPLHHCLYCLGRKVADGPLMLGLLLTSSICALAAAPVWLLSAGRAELAARRRTTARLLHVAALGQAGAWVMIGVHLLAG